MNVIKTLSDLPNLPPTPRSVAKDVLRYVYQTCIIRNVRITALALDSILYTLLSRRAHQDLYTLVKQQPEYKAAKWLCD